MASKLNAFLASVPANADAPSPPKSAPAAFGFPHLELKAPPASVGCSPATPQPPPRRRRGSTSRRSNNLELKLASDGGRSSLGSNQDEPEDSAERETDGGQAPTPLKAFMRSNANLKAKTSVNPTASALLRTGSNAELDEKSEAGPMRMLSTQGSHHRRVSTDTTLFSRYLRQQAHRDISDDTVRYFARVPIITVTKAAEEALESELDELDDDSSPRHKDNNAEDQLRSGGPVASLLQEPEEMLALFRLGGTIPVASALELVGRATNLMALEQNVISIRAPYTLVGDLHGQFQDLLELFRVHGVPAVDNPFLFLGDYVDRGVSSCEIILLLLAFKVALPESVHLLRGNHECRSLSTFYGFRAECLQKYGPVVYNRVVKCFESMPLAARLETAHGTFLAVHGGLSPDIALVEDINMQVNRFMEPEPSGALCDLLWADPAKGDAQEHEWAPNGMRGCSFTFNERACREFLAHNQLLSIIRAHELEEDGFREHFVHRRDEDEAGELVLPPVVTVFSAPEYCNTNHNMGATLKIPWEQQNGRLLQYQQHKRSCYAELAFARASEDEAMKAFLAEHLAFLPLDFYDLVGVSRQLRLSLERAASSSLSPTAEGLQPARKVSFVSSLCAPSASFCFSEGQSDKTDEEEDPELPVSPPARPPRAHELQDKHETLRDSDAKAEELHEWELVGDAKAGDAKAGDATDGDVKSKKSRAKQDKKAKKAKKAQAKKDKKERKKDKKRWDTSSIVSGWKFCPGFVRFYDRYFSRPSLSSKKSRDSDVDARPGARSHMSRSLSFVNRYRSLKRSTSAATDASDTNPDVVEPPATGPTRRKSMTDWLPMPSFEQVAALTTTLQGHLPAQTNGVHVFTKTQWQALKLLFALLDVDGKGVLGEESFVVLLAEQDADAYATEDELSLLLEVMDCDGDGLITEQDFLLFAYRALLRWKKALHGSGY